jgi:hypothetical protein
MIEALRASAGGWKGLIHEAAEPHKVHKRGSPGHDCYSRCMRPSATTYVNGSRPSGAIRRNIVAAHLGVLWKHSSEGPQHLARRMA